MMNFQINQSHSSFHNLFTLQKPFLDCTHHSSSSTYSSSPTPLLLPTTAKKHINATRTRRPMSAGKIKAILDPFTKVISKVTGKMYTSLFKYTAGKPSRILDDIADYLWDSMSLEFVSKDLDSNGQPKTVVTRPRYRYNYQYSIDFTVPEDFGEIGAVLVENDYYNALFLEKIELSDNIVFTCNSWLHTKSEDPERRIFFADKCYLPSDTPQGLKSLREKDLESFRGSGQGERKPFERVYDYDVYNDLGNPDKNLVRPVLGGKEFPYPRRCRTGRKMSSKDPLTETGSSENFYVPIDEDFSETKMVDFNWDALKNKLRYLTNGTDEDFHVFHDIDSLFREEDGITGDPFFWLHDDEFSRQMIAGLNPCSIQLVKEWPLNSKLEPEVYGPPESAITKEIVEQIIKGFMTFEEALAQNKLFMLDYHDLLLPYVNRTRDLEGRSLHGSRTLMFLAPTGTLTPVAIELTRPPSEGKPQWKHVYTPCMDATGSWL